MPAGQPPPEENQIRALVVDDAQNIADVLSMALRYEDFAVEQAANGQQALKGAEDFRPHIIILDVMLPDLDGFEAIRLLRDNALTREIPVVILSALELGDDDTRALGPTVHLTKPFSGADLLGIIRANLRLDRSSAR